MYREDASIAPDKYYRSPLSAWRVADPTHARFGKRLRPLYGHEEPYQPCTLLIFATRADRKQEEFGKGDLSSLR